MLFTRTISSMILVLSLSLASCGGEDIEIDEVTNPQNSSQTIHFPRQPKTDDYDTADFHGTLQVVDGCLRLIDAPNVGVLVIWPHDFDLRIQRKEIQVLNGNDDPIAQVGDRLVIGGSGVPGSDEDKLGGCPGPFWNASDQIRIEH